MAHHNSDEKIVYVGDSRVRKRTNADVPPLDYSAYPGKSEAFVPNFLLKEWMVGAVVLVGFMVLVMSEPAPLGYPADPTNTSFIPMPDWYFLFLYQLLKYPYTSEHFKIVGTLIFPGIAFGSLLLAPFLDVGPERRFYRRPIASALMIFAVVATSYLTITAWSHYKEELKAAGMIPEDVQREEELKAGKIQPGVSTANQQAALPPIVDASDKAHDIYLKATCVTCHGKDMEGMKSAAIPPLVGVGDKYDQAKIEDIMKNGLEGKMPPGQWDASKSNGLTDDDLTALAVWLSKQKAPQK